MANQAIISVVGEEEIREAAWNLCKKYDGTLNRRDEVLLRNRVSEELEKTFGIEIENLFREEWQEEVRSFSAKYGYGPMAVTLP